MIERRKPGGLANGALLGLAASLSALAAFPGGLAHAATAPVAQIRPKARVVVLTDIGNEPDDAESFVRFLVYSNEYDVEGLVATTSVHQPATVQPQLLQERIAAYALVLDNLRRHASGYPDAEQLKSLVREGSTQYGMTGVGPGKDTAGSRQIIAAVDRPDARPVWISIWGGAADLAQALWTVRATRSQAELDAFVAKLRVYSISDQDDAGPWLRRTFPSLFWIASVHGWNQYQMAAWTGISGDLLRKEKWPSFELVTREWIADHIQAGPLGRLYPSPEFIMEGDTPAFLGLIRNGLDIPSSPDAGGWGGRYVLSSPGASHYADAVDTYVDDEGVQHSSNQASIFRWRKAIQHDFAARMQWTRTGIHDEANHNPIAVLNGTGGTMPIIVHAKAGETITLDSTGSCDPDGDAVSIRWWLYGEPTGGFRPPEAKIALPNGPKSELRVPPVSAAVTIHVIMEVTDAGTPSLTSYRRLLIEVAP